MQQRSIPVCIVLSIVTCGIYLYYWLYTLNEVAVQNNPNEWDKSGGMVILLSFVTCGIYYHFWNYKMGKAFEPLFGEDKSVMFIILSLVGFSVVNLALIQDAINKKVGG